MNVFLPSIVLVLLMISIGCKESSTPSTVEKNQSQPVIKEDSILIKKEPTVEKVVHKKVTYYYVSAKSGLNYRAAPKGEVLGKFKLNDYLMSIEQTGIFDEVIDDNKQVKGEWLGIKKGTDTVYVFSGFLASNITFSDIEIYWATPHDPNENTIGFINLSERYPWNYESQEASFIPEESIGKTKILFNEKQTNRILKKMNISKNQNIFIYHFKTDQVYTIPIRGLRAFAKLDGYSSPSDNHLSEQDYEIGLRLGKQFDKQGENFAYIGLDHPFQSGKFKPMVCKPADYKDLPKLVRENESANNSSMLYSKSLIYSNGALNYYFIDYNKKQNDTNRYLRSIQVQNTKTNEIVYQDLQTDSESSYISELATENNKKHIGQYTGQLFKNKPAIIHGLMSHSFGCPGIDFLSPTEPPIRILCDNRH